jgi:hypothetical protein
LWEIGSFLLWWEIFITTGKKRYSRLSGGWAINYNRKKKTVICLLGARYWGLQPEKKDTVVCLAGCAVCCISFWFWREIGSFLVVAGNFHYDRKKKRYSRLSGWCAINYDRKKKDKDTLRPEKKRYSRLSDGCAVLAITTGKKKDTVVCLAG